MAKNGRFNGLQAAVTGAGGFIGGAIAAKLAGGGADVIGIDVDEAAAERVRELGARPAAADVTDGAAVERAIEGADLVVHAAAYVRDWGTMAEFVRVNARGTAAVLDAAGAVGAKRVVHISSVVVYGYDHPGEQGEGSFRRACGVPYIDTKSSSDRLACRRGAVVIRPGDVYGPGSIPWLVRPLEMAQLGRLAVPSPGDGLMLPVYIDDLVEAVLLGVEKGAPGSAYTAWDGSAVPFRDYFDRIAEIAGASPTRVVPRPVMQIAGAASEAWARLRGRPPMISARAHTFVGRRGTASTERIRSELGWRPQVDLSEGLRRSGEWARAQGLVRGASPVRDA